jgi:ADP-heptose:LPS heptosyltransferase
MNVLAVRQDNNGDVLLAGPAIRALAAGATRLTLLCGPSGKAAAQALPGPDDVLVYEAGWIEALPGRVDAAGVLDVVERIRERSIDRAVIFTSFHQSPLPMALVLRMAGVASIAAISEDYPGSLLDVRHRDVPEDGHEVERALSLARAAGFELPPHDEGKLAMRIAPHNVLGNIGRYVVVHPGATVPARAWSEASNAALVHALVRDGYRVVVTGSMNERQLCERVAGRFGTNLAGRTDFAMLGRVIADAAAIVVGNTGAAHVAAAVGTPVVSIFAPTIPASRFRPWAVDHVLLGDQEIACRGCRARVCPRGDHACVARITIDDVRKALQSLLSRTVRA